MKKLTGILPSIISAYFVVFLYSHNCEELIFGKSLYPLLWALLFSILVTVVTLSVSNSKIKGEIISSVYILMFFMYGYLFDLFSYFDVIEVKHRFFMPIYIICLYFVTNIITRVINHNNLHMIRSRLIYIFIILLAFNMVNIFPKELRKLREMGAVNETASANNTAVASAKSPDVYFIILDEYASSKTIRNIWGYDNSLIEDYLIGKGFTVAQDAVVKFNTTTKAIPSYLNMEYIHKSTDTTTCYKMINQSKVMAKFKKLGYTNIAVDNWFSANPAKGPVLADYNFNYGLDAKIAVVDGLTNLIVNQSMLRPFSHILYTQYDDIDDCNRNSTVYAFGKLLNIVNIRGPKFVYAHILCPHTPFTFDQNGGAVNVKNKYNWKDKKYYLEQYIYINKNIITTVNSILKNSSNPPIIIIQSDHGPRPQFGQDPATRFTIPQEEMFRTFYSYYLPNEKGRYLAEKVDPVNSFKMVFDKITAPI